jgi:hypothetical protein
VIGLRALEPFVRAPRPRGGARCELCGGPLAAAHAHVADLERRAIHCACGACATLFARPAGGRLRTVPSRVLFDPDLSLEDDRWARIGVPVRLAFVFQSSSIGRAVAVYPSPAGPVEAEVDARAWADLAALSPLFACAEPDVEALLVRGERGRPLEVLLAPIDACYALVAVVRRGFEGIDGGDAVRAEIDRSLGELRARRRPLDRGARRPG